MWMIACSISNSVDKRHFDQREVRYMQIVQKYEKKELDAFPDFFAHIVLGMEDTPDRDFLGELYMGLKLGNNYAGQFFTPYHACEVMARATIDDALLKDYIMRRRYVSINDCACGAGATLIAAANYLRAAGINYQRQALFVAQDIDATVALMCYIQLSLLGCAGYVKIGNTLTEPMTGSVLYGDGKGTTWYTPMYFSDHWTTIRAIERAKSLVPCVATTFPADEAGRPMPNMAELESQGQTPSAPSSESDSGKLKQTQNEPHQPTFTISTKKNVGQVMFDFG